MNQVRPTYHLTCSYPQVILSGSSSQLCSYQSLIQPHQTLVFFSEQHELLRYSSSEANPVLLGLSMTEINCFLPLLASRFYFLPSKLRTLFYAYSFLMGKSKGQLKIGNLGCSLTDADLEYDRNEATVFTLHILL